MKEVWKTIEAFPFYAVSSFGRIKRISPAPGATVGRVLKPSLRSGYHSVNLCRGTRAKQDNVHVHRAVAEAFIPNPLSLPEVNHKGGKTDNRTSMLEWRSVLGHRQDQTLRGQTIGDGVAYDKERGKYKVTFQRKTIGRYKTYDEALAVRLGMLQALPYIL